MKLYYVVNARMPNEKAHGIQITRMYEALRSFGGPVELVTPRRFAGGMYAWGRIFFALSSCLFMLRSFLYLFWKRIQGEPFVIYTVDMDTFSYSLLPLIAPTFSEMHSPKRATVVNRFFFRRVRGIIATTRATKLELEKTFRIPSDRVIVEPNGVSVAQFVGISKEDARTRLSLSLNEKIAVYVGRLYAWKGLEVLPSAFEKLDGIQGYLVGGEKSELQELTRCSVPENLHAVGVRPKEEIPFWLAAADALIVIGTSHNSDSMRYTSPMKVFEYMAAERPIVASRTEALQEVLREDDAFWYTPDDANSLANAVSRAVVGQAKANLAAGRDWSSRARRIVHFMNHAG